MIAWSNRNRAVRIFSGLILLTMAAVCSFFSVLAALLVAALRIIALLLAVSRPQEMDRECGRCGPRENGIEIRLQKGSLKPGINRGGGI